MLAVEKNHDQTVREMHAVVVDSASSIAVKTQKTRYLHNVPDAASAALQISHLFRVSVDLVGAAAPQPTSCREKKSPNTQDRVRGGLTCVINDLAWHVAIPIFRKVVTLARIRAIKPEFFDDPDVGRLSAEAALVFVGLWTQADRCGRLKDDPKRLKVRIRPYSACDFEDTLMELVDAGFIIRYQSEDGSRLLQVRTFEKHQRVHSDEKELYPAPTGIKTGQPEKKPLYLLSGDLVSGERERMLVSRNTAEPLRDSTAVLEFPTTGPTNTWSLTTAYLADLKTTYDTIAVESECRKALAWIRANMGRRKTARGMPNFLVNWLNRAANSNTTSHRHISMGSPNADAWAVLERKRS